MALSYAANRGSKGGVGGLREGRVGTQLIATSLYQSGLASAGAPLPATKVHTATRTRPRTFGTG